MDELLWCVGLCCECLRLGVRWSAIHGEAELFLDLLKCTFAWVSKERSRRLSCCGIHS